MQHLGLFAGGHRSEGPIGSFVPWDNRAAPISHDEVMGRSSDGADVKSSPSEVA